MYSLLFNRSPEDGRRLMQVPITVPEWASNLRLLEAGHAAQWEKASIPLVNVNFGDCWDAVYTRESCCGANAQRHDCWVPGFTQLRCCLSQVPRRQPVELESLDTLLNEVRLQQQDRNGIDARVKSMARATTCEPLGQGWDHFGYTQMYQELMEGLVGSLPSGPTVLQIGVCYGESLFAWSEWLRPVGGSVVGVDIFLPRFAEARHLLAAKPRFSARGGGQALEALEVDSQEAAAELRWRYGGESFDMIVDDGCHTASCITRTFERLFVSLLKPGGVYVVEDARKAQVQDGLAVFRRLSASLQMYNLTGRALNLEGMIQHDPLEAWVDRVEFHRNMVVVRKRHGFLEPYQPDW